jgi:hypothetical protein
MGSATPLVSELTSQVTEVNATAPTVGLATSFEPSTVLPDTHSQSVLSARTTVADEKNSTIMCRQKNNETLCYDEKGFIIRERPPLPEHYNQTRRKY